MASILIITGLAFALAYLWYCDRGKSWPSTIVKTVPLLAFAMAGLVANAPWLLALGLFLSALGDFGLSREGDNWFLAGLVSFALAHFAYIAHFVVLSDVWPWMAYQSALVPALVLTAIVASTEIWLSPHTGALKWPVRGYAVIIGLMGLSALVQPLPLALWGAVLFIASDLVLAVGLFRLQDGTPARSVTSYTLWPLYIGGQLCLLLSGVFI